MTGLLEKAAGFFVAPTQTAAFAPPRPRPAVIGLVAAEPDVLVASGAVAASLRREAKAATALACVWRGHDDLPLPAPAPAGPGVSRIAAKLARRGLQARQCGLVCVVELPAEAGAATAAFREAVAAADAPVVLALARREPAFDGLLAESDRLVLAAAEDADALLGDLAYEGLARLGPSVQRLPLPRGLIARQAARLGLRTPAAPGPATCEVSAAALQESPT